MTESNVVLHDKRNLLARRREVRIQISNPSGQPTPSRKQLKQQIGAVLGINPELIVIIKVKPDHGTNIITVDAHIYDSSDKILAFERDYLLNRDQGIKKQKNESNSQTAQQEQKA
jgi:ribosomal protein S24E